MQIADSAIEGAVFLSLIPAGQEGEDRPGYELVTEQGVPLPSDHPLQAKVAAAFQRQVASGGSFPAGAGSSWSLESLVMYAQTAGAGAGYSQVEGPGGANRRMAGQQASKQEHGQRRPGGGEFNVFCAIPQPPNLVRSSRDALRLGPQGGAPQARTPSGATALPPESTQKAFNLTRAVKFSKVSKPNLRWKPQAVGTAAGQSPLRQSGGGSPASARQLHGPLVAATTTGPAQPIELSPRSLDGLPYRSVAGAGAAASQQFALPRGSAKPTALAERASPRRRPPALHRPAQGHATGANRSPSTTFNADLASLGPQKSRSPSGSADSQPARESTGRLRRQSAACAAAILEQAYAQAQVATPE